jgi:hypothetical protein
MSIDIFTWEKRPQYRMRNFTRAMLGVGPLFAQQNILKSRAGITSGIGHITSAITLFIAYLVWLLFHSS